MKGAILGWFGALAIGMLGSSAALAASDFFLKLDGVDGETAVSGNEGSLAVQSYSWGTSNPTSVGSSGMSAGRSRAAAAEPTRGTGGSLSVTKQYDKASPKLYMACAKGEHIASAQLKRCENGACQTYELKDVVIRSVSVSNDGRGNATEQLSLNYAKIEFELASQAELRESPAQQSTGTTTTKPVKSKPN